MSFEPSALPLGDDSDRITAAQARQPVERQRFNLALWFVLLFAGFFLLYQASLAFQATRFHPFLLFGADSMEDLFKGIWHGRIANTARLKHPLFPVVTMPLYQIGSSLYSFVPGSLGENLALAFPCALLGAINVCLSFWIFMENYPKRWLALVFVLLYGLSAATWIFSSIPETYVLTTLCTNLFFGVLLRWKDREDSALRMAGLNVLACYASPQQIFLAIVPCVYYLQAGHWSKQATRQVVRYVAILATLFIVPYGFFVNFLGFGWKFPAGYLYAYGQIQNFLDPAWYLVVFQNFMVFSVVGPIVLPKLYCDPSFIAFTQVSLPWIVVAGLYSICSARCLWALPRSPATFATLWPGAVLFILCYVGFFQFFNPKESFIYTLPMLLPWLLLIHSGYVNCHNVKWTALLVFLLFGVAANNFKLIVFLRGFIETFKVPG